MPVEAMLIGNMHADLPTIQEAFATAIVRRRCCAAICAS